MQMLAQPTPVSQPQGLLATPTSTQSPSSSASSSLLSSSSPSLSSPNQLLSSPTMTHSSRPHHHHSAPRKPLSPALSYLLSSTAIPVNNRKQRRGSRLASSRPRSLSSSSSCSVHSAGSMGSTGSAGSSKTPTDESLLLLLSASSQSTACCSSSSSASSSSLSSSISSRRSSSSSSISSATGVASSTSTSPPNTTSFQSSPRFLGKPSEHTHSTRSTRLELQQQLQAQQQKQHHLRQQQLQRELQFKRQQRRLLEKLSSPVVSEDEGPRQPLFMDLDEYTTTASTASTVSTIRALSKRKSTKRKCSPSSPPQQRFWNSSSSASSSDSGLIFVNDEMSHSIPSDVCAYDEGDDKEEDNDADDDEDDDDDEDEDDDDYEDSDHCFPLSMARKPHHAFTVPSVASSPEDSCSSSSTLTSVAPDRRDDENGSRGFAVGPQTESANGAYRRVASPSPARSRSVSRRGSMVLLRPSAVAGAAGPTLASVDSASHPLASTTPSRTQVSVTPLDAGYDADDAATSCNEAGGAAGAGDGTAGATIKKRSALKKFKSYRTFVSNLTASIKAISMVASSFSSSQQSLLSSTDVFKFSPRSTDEPIPGRTGRFAAVGPTPGLKPNTKPKPQEKQKEVAKTEPNGDLPAAGTNDASSTCAPAQTNSETPTSTTTLPVIAPAPKDIPLETYNVQEYVLPPVARGRDFRENSDFLRIYALESLMKKHGKFDPSFPGKAQPALMPRSDEVPPPACGTPIVGNNNRGGYPEAYKYLYTANHGPLVQPCASLHYDSGSTTGDESGSSNINDNKSMLAILERKMSTASMLTIKTTTVCKVPQRWIPLSIATDDDNDNETTNNETNETNE